MPTSTREAAIAEDDRQQQSAEEGGAPARTRVCINVDMDTASDILQGYGLADDSITVDPVWEHALPRLLSLFDEQGVRGSFFVIARDVASYAEHIREIQRRGHEVASHSMSHEQPFRKHDEDRLERETRGSKDALESVITSRVEGFKAPGWDFDQRTLRSVAAAGYRYDASGFPSPLLLAVRALVWWGGTRRGFPVNLADFAQLFSRRAPRRPDRYGLRRFPVATTPLLRLPVYNTMRHYLGDRRLDRMARRVVRGAGCISFSMHAIDLLDIDRDHAPRALLQHPGMSKSLEQRTQALEETIGVYRSSGVSFTAFADECGREEEGTTGTVP